MSDPIRVILKVNEDSHPDLYEDLKNIDPRRRGERMRMLSTAELRAQIDGRNISASPSKRYKSPAARDSASEGKSPSPAAEETSANSKPEKTQQEPKPAEENDQHKEVRDSMLGGMASQF